MNRSIAYILALSLLLPFHQMLGGAFEVSKKVNKEFKISPGGTVDLVNKFGKLHVNTNLAPGQVQVAAEVIVVRNSEKEAAKVLSEIYIDFIEADGGLKIVAHLPEKLKTGSKEKVEVNMTVSMSSQNPIKAKHSFGDMYLGNHFSSQDVKVSYGHLKAEELKGKTDLKVAFGNLTLKSAQSAQLKIEYSTANIERLGTVDLKDDFSSISISKAGKLTLTSKYGKLDIDEVDHLSGSASFASDFNVGLLNSSFDVHLKYVGDLEVNLAGSSVEIVKVNASFSNAEISYPANLNFSLKGDFSFGSIDYPTARIQSSKIEKGMNSQQVLINYGQAQPTTRFELSGSYSEVELEPR